MANYYIRGFEEVKQESLFGIGEDTILDNTDPYLKPLPASNNGIINIIKDFSWFSGGSTAALAGLDRTPWAALKERDQVLNSTLSQAIYYMNAAAKGIQDTGDQALSKFSEVLGIDAPVGGTGGALNPLQKLRDKLISLDGGDDQALLQANNLASLAGIYLTKKTDFNYVFPYFENPPSVSNNWGDKSKTSAAESMINTGMDIVDEITSFVNIAQPGVYIQKPQHFNHNSTGQSITLQFPLFNTIKRTDKLPYQQNYELLWLLAYQNKTYKTSFGRSKPPKIYSVTIPGVVNMPYAFISNMSIDFIGTVRNKTVQIGDKSVTTPIPEAYNVRITVDSLLSDYANLMVGAGFYANMEQNSATIQST